MNQRLIAALVATPLLLVLVALAVFAPLPYATYSPGPTYDVLGEDDEGAETVQIPGQKTYRDDGQLRMTTVRVSRVEADISMVDLLGAWISGDEAVYPYESVHGDETQQESDLEGAAQMVTSKDVAVAAALNQLDYDIVADTPQVAAVAPDQPADGKLEVRDEFVSVAGTPVASPQDVVDEVGKIEPGTEVAIEVVRKDEAKTVRVAPADVDGQPQIGVSLGVGFDLPFDVDINVPPAIQGPSAGLMFALSVYDTLTPDPLAGGAVVAGTGTMLSVDGTVGPIGGIQQKIAASREAGAEVFLVPRGNCESAEGAASGDVRLVRATNLSDAISSLEAYAEDPDADLPSCDDIADDTGDARE